MVLIAAASATAAVSVGSAVAGGIASNQAADAANANAAQQNAYNEAVFKTRSEYQLKLEDYQDTVWSQDLDFATKTLDYQKSEFARQETWVGDATAAVEKNTANSENQQLLKTVQQNVATSLQEFDAGRQTTMGEATVATGAASRGATGNTVDAVIQDVARQGSEAQNVMEMNRSAANQQAMQDLLGIKAAGDSQLVGIAGQVKTYSPNTPVRSPQPLEPVIKGAPVGDVATPGYIGTAFGALGGIASGFNTYANLSGMFQTPKS